MADLIFVSITLSFFVLCAFYVKWCDRIIGPDSFAEATSEVAAIHESAHPETGVAA